MEYIKKNLTVILLSVMCTLLFVITVLLIVNNNTFKFSNSSNKENTNNKNIKEVEKNNKKEETKQVEKQEEKSEAQESKVETKEEKVNTNTNQNINTNQVVEEKSEANLLSHFENEVKMFDTKDTSITDKLKASFTSIIDFIFYDKEIKGYTFKELTNTAKLKVISIALTIDNKIDNYFPNYKDKIKDKYNNIKASLATKYLEVTANFCSKDPETCKQAKEDFEAMKKSFGLTGSKVSEAAKKAGSKVKELYEGWR